MQNLARCQIRTSHLALLYTHGFVGASAKKQQGFQQQVSNKHTPTTELRVWCDAQSFSPIQQSQSTAEALHYARAAVRPQRVTPFVSRLLSKPRGTLIWDYLLPLPFLCIHHNSDKTIALFKFKSRLVAREALEVVHSVTMGRKYCFLAIIDIAYVPLYCTYVHM